MNESKYKKWGWAAVIGLVGVILIAGFIVAGTMAGPKPNKEEVAKNSVETTKESADNKENKSENKSEDTSSKEENKTEESGRKEEQTAPVENTPVVETPVVEAPVAVNTNSADNLPTTGPESTLIATVMVGLVAYLLALNVNLLKKQN